MHKFYEVPLNPNLRADKDQALVDTVESAFRKYMNHFPNFSNISLTLSIQFTTM
jgi:hypothetical protein